MIPYSLLNKKDKDIALNMYKKYLLTFTMDDMIDSEVLAFDEWIKKSEIFKD